MTGCPSLRWPSSSRDAIFTVMAWCDSLPRGVPFRLIVIRHVTRHVTSVLGAAGGIGGERATRVPDAVLAQLELLCRGGP